MTLEDSESKDCEFCVSSGIAIGRSGHTKHSDIEHDKEAMGGGHRCTTYGVNTPTAVRERDWRTPSSEMEAINHCELAMTGHLQKLPWVAREKLRRSFSFSGEQLIQPVPNKAACWGWFGRLVIKREVVSMCGLIAS